MNFFRSGTLMLISALLVSLSVRAQTTSSKADSLGPFSLSNIDTWSIQSKTIGEKYTLYVLRTAAYDTSRVRLPVLYMTDGDWNMTVAMNCFSMLRQDYTTREPLVVGIGYGKQKNQRMRDLDPQTGGPAFLTFIEKEVMPFIEATYRTTNNKALYGYSMGGLFTTYTLFHRPDLFDMIFIGAPGNDGNQLLPEAKHYAERHNTLTSKVFIGVGSYEKQVVHNINAFSAYMQSQKLAGLTLRKEFTPSANHGAALAQVMQNAIAFGYCERLTPVVADPVVFKKYSGTFTPKDPSLPAVLITTHNGKLYWQPKRAGALVSELLPSSKTDYFMVENERMRFTFKEVSRRMTLMIIMEDKTEYHFSKKNEALQNTR